MPETGSIRSLMVTRIRPCWWSVRTDKSGYAAMLKSAREFADRTWEASALLEAGSVGYSATRRPERFEGLKLRTSAWPVESAVVEYANSSFFEDLSRFPAGTADVDSAPPRIPAPTTVPARRP